MNRRLQEERESMMMHERWGIVWLAGAASGTCRVTNLIDIDPINGNQKFVFFERREGRRPPERLFRYIISVTTHRFLTAPEEEPLEYRANSKGGYRIFLRNGHGRSLRVDAKGGVKDFLMSADNLAKLLHWFEFHKPEHIRGEDVAVYAL